MFGRLQSSDVPKRFFLSLIFVFLLVIFCFQGVTNPATQKLERPLYRHIGSISIAVSELYHGADFGKIGYAEVYNHFSSAGFDYILDGELHKQKKQIVINAENIDPVLKEATLIAIEDPSSKFLLHGNPKGMVYFYKAAFAAFGPSLNSVGYLIYSIYALLLGIAFVSVRREPQSLGFLIILLLSLVILQNEIFDPKTIFGKLGNLHNSRSLPILGMSAALISIILSISSKQKTLLNVSCCLVSGFILGFALVARSSLAWVLPAILGIAVILSFVRLLSMHSITFNSFQGFHSIRVWPLIVFLISSLLTTQALNLGVSDEYETADATKSHILFHTLLVSDCQALRYHALQSYHSCGDQYAGNKVELFIEANGIPRAHMLRKGGHWNYGKYEEVAREIFFLSLWSNLPIKIAFATEQFKTLGAHSLRMIKAIDPFTLPIITMSIFIVTWANMNTRPLLVGLLLAGVPFLFAGYLTLIFFPGVRLRNELIVAMSSLSLFAFSLLAIFLVQQTIFIARKIAKEQRKKAMGT